MTADQPRLTDGTSLATYRSRPPAIAPNSVFQSPGTTPDSARSKVQAAIVVPSGAS